jgi:hypothetical protein
MRRAAQSSRGLCRSLDSARAALCVRRGDRRSAGSGRGDRYRCAAARTRRADKFGQCVGRWIVDADGHATLGRDTIHNDRPTLGRDTIHNDHPTLGRNTIHNDHPAGRRSTVDYHFTAGQFPDHQHHIDDDDQPVVWRFVGRRVGGWVCGSGGQSVVWSRSGHRVAGGGRPGGWVICDRRRVQQ